MGLSIGFGIMVWGYGFELHNYTHNTIAPKRFVFMSVISVLYLVTISYMWSSSFFSPQF